MAAYTISHGVTPVIRAEKAPENKEKKPANLIPKLQWPKSAKPLAIDWEKLKQERSSIPTAPPKQSISNWPKLHTLLDPMDPSLRSEIIKYGEFCQATYDSFDFDPLSDYCGSCRYHRSKLFDVLGLQHHGYDVVRYVYAMSHIDVPKWLQKVRPMSDVWSHNSNWIGYVAVSNDEETARIGRRDIAVAWRGTVAPSEWYKDFQSKMQPIREGSLAKVELGFHNIYTTKSATTRYNKASAAEQVMEEIKCQVTKRRARGEEVGVTITGHSLGGAIALLNAHDVVSSIPDVHTRVVSFGAPRVGNSAFCEEVSLLGVNVVRVVVEQDIVPKSLGYFLNEETVKGGWVYAHVGRELKVSAEASPFLRSGGNLAGFHDLETYLHLVDGYDGLGLGFRKEASRDIALVNKNSDMLLEELRIPKKWFQFSNKGLVRNTHGRWVMELREPEDVPVPGS